MSSNLQGSSKQLFEEELKEEQPKEKRLDSSKLCILHKKPLPCEDCYSGNEECRVGDLGREIWKRIGIIEY
jgi:hypothetical protein